MGDDGADSYELFMHHGPGQPRTSFGITSSADDIPGLVTTTDNKIWELAYVDSVDRIAVYVPAP